jgi:hypothetical protein
MSNDWNEAIIQDLDFLRQVGLIEVVGINPEGEWLYGLSKKTIEFIDESKGEFDPYEAMSVLLEEAHRIEENRSMQEGSD